MYTTVEECTNRMVEITNRMAEIELEVKCLTLELTYITQLEDLLKTSSSPSSLSSPSSPPDPDNINKPTLSDLITQIIRNNPGTHGGNIRNILNDETTQSQISYILTKLKAKGIIVNRGTAGMHAKWYSKES